MIEVWSWVVGYEGKYMVSTKGRILRVPYTPYRNYRSLKKTLPLGYLATYKDKAGYERVQLWDCGNRIKLVHRLVAQAFLPNPQLFSEVNHKNEIKDDNRVENLEWCNRQYNTRYGTRSKRQAESVRGKNCKPVAQMTMEGNLIRRWSSISEAAKFLGIHRTGIGMCCNGRIGSYLKFKWALIEK